MSSDLFFGARGVGRATGLIEKLKRGPWKVCPRKVDAVGVIGMILFWHRTCNSSVRAASLAFGSIVAPKRGWIKFDQRTLLHAPLTSP